MLKPVKLEVLYDNMSTDVRYFNTREEAQWYVQTEGDHVWEYKVTGTKDE